MSRLFKKNNLINSSIVLLLLVVINFSLAQELWQSANNINQGLLSVERSLYRAARSENPVQEFKNAEQSVLDLNLEFQTALAQQLPNNIQKNSQEILNETLEAARTGNIAEFSSARAELKITLLHGSYLNTIAALDSKNIEQVEAWLQLRDYRQATKASIIKDSSQEAINALKKQDISFSEAKAIILSDLNDSYFFRLRDALNNLTEAHNKGFNNRVAEWKAKARAYYQILHNDIKEQLGTQSLVNIDLLFTELDNENLLDSVEKIKTALLDYHPIKLSQAEIDKKSQSLKLFTELIWIEYKDGVRDGKINIPIEYTEAMTFREQAELNYSDLASYISAKDAVASTRLKEIYNELKEIMTAMGPRPLVKELVAEAGELISASLEVSNEVGSSLSVVKTLINSIELAISNGDYKAAEQTRLEAYAFFETGAEQRLRTRAIRLNRTVEGLFWEGTANTTGLSTLIKEQASSKEISATIAKLNIELDNADKVLNNKVGAIMAFLNSLAIILREGLEAVLIIGVILGYMRATNTNKEYILWVYYGIFAALLLSFATYWAAQSLITISAANRELMEGITSLIAVVVLFYVSNWIFEKVYVTDWLDFVKKKVGTALTTGSALTLAGLGFTVVYREGFETVLFYQAILFDSPKLPVLFGFITGTIIILIVAWAILYFSQKIPLKPFFMVTSGLLMLLAFSFVGKGFREFQEAGVVKASLVNWIPEKIFLMEGFGIFPTLETSLAQAVFVFLLILSFGYQRYRKNKLQIAASSLKGVKP